MKPGVPKKPTRRTQKNAPAKESWQALRERYTWHLRPPFKDQFDRTHWWKKDKAMGPPATLYELARRHPIIGETRLKMEGQPESKLLDEPASIHCLYRIGMRSWPSLTLDEQEYWIMSAGKMKGLDCRDDLEKCNSITRGAFTDLLLRCDTKLERNPKDGADWITLIVKRFMTNRPTSEEMESAIARNAVAAHRNGHILIAASPDLNAAEADLLLPKAWRASLQMISKQEFKQRARTDDWLPLIAAFEKEKTGDNRTISRAFIPYRRALDGIRFSSPVRWVWS